jgi:Lrp/AsnC family leucine-responsive transcriptional regulator
MAEETEAIDRLDREILAILMDDARMSWQTLGDRVHLSPNAVAERVRRLMRRGIIRRFTIDIDQRALGRDLMAVIDARITADDDFDEAVRARDDVVWASHVTGVPDVKIAVACDGTAGLDAFLHWLHSHGATDTRTDVVLRPIK